MGGPASPRLSKATFLPPPSLCPPPLTQAAGGGPPLLRVMSAPPRPPQEHCGQIWRTQQCLGAGTDWGGGAAAPGRDCWQLARGQTPQYQSGPQFPHLAKSGWLFPPGSTSSGEGFREGKGQGDWLQLEPQWTPGPGHLGGGAECPPTHPGQVAPCRLSASLPANSPGLPG